MKKRIWRKVVAISQYPKGYEMTLECGHSAWRYGKDYHQRIVCGQCERAAGLMVTAIPMLDTGTPIDYRSTTLEVTK